MGALYYDCPGLSILLARLPYSFDKHGRSCYHIDMPEVWHKKNSVFQSIVQLLLPAVCTVCNRTLAYPLEAQKPVCGDCERAIQLHTPPLCRKCGRSLNTPPAPGPGDCCSRCAAQELYFDAAFSPARYEGIVKELIRQYKYAGKEYLADTLGGLIAEGMVRYAPRIMVCDCIVPIPLFSQKQRAREFNQALALSQCLAASLRKPILAGVLVKHRETAPQASLHAAKRRENVKGCFSVTDAEAVRDRVVLLVDDVLTTGATCSEAALALKSAGAYAVHVVAAAS